MVLVLLCIIHQSMLFQKKFVFIINILNLTGSHLEIGEFRIVISLGLQISVEYCLKKSCSIRFSLVLGYARLKTMISINLCF